MKMHELVKYNIPAEIIELWREGESDNLLPLQEMAIKRYGLFGAENILIQAPTSSGKTFIGEMAAIHSALGRKKVVYLVPLKALAEEKYRVFREKYSQYGFRVIVSSRDHREFDRQFENGQFEIAVVVYEKLSQLLVRRPEQLKEIGLVIADELEILSDPDRGAMVEILLTRILFGQGVTTPCPQGNPRLIGLSAVIGHADKLAEWMEAHMVFYERRPVELRFGVLYEGKFHYRTYNEHSEGQEPMREVYSESAWEVLTENVCELAKQGEPTLIFVKARHESRHGAELLAQRVISQAAAKSIAALQALEATRSRDALLETLNAGVAFHNADLSPDERRIIEQGFRQGEIKVLVSTSTLATGMNLPARNAFIASDKWKYDARLGMPWKTPILRSECDNMGGRAGRYGMPYEFGRAILIATTPFDFETLWRRYVEGECEPIDPRLAHDALEDHVLRLVASRYCRTHDELLQFIENTLTGKWIWQETMTLDEVAFRVKSAVNRAIDAGVIIQHPPDGRLEATPLGLATAAKGITIATARELEHWIGESETRVWSDLDLIFAAATSRDGRMLQIGLTTKEYEQADYPGQIKCRTKDQDISADVPLNRIRNCNLMPFFEEVRGIKVALFLDRWIDHASLHDLEEQFETTAGQVVTAAEQVSWLLDGTAALAVALGAQNDFVERIKNLSERVQKGLRAEGLPLSRLGLPSLTRTMISNLVAHDLHDAKAIADIAPEALTAWVPLAEARRMKEWALGVEQREIQSKPAKKTAALLIDDKHPGEFQLDGIRIRLQEKQYRMICILASLPGECVPYDTIYKMVWGETIVEPNQMHFQKRKILDAVQQELPGRAELITTVPKRGFMLNLPPDQVVIRAAKLSTAA